MLSDDHLFHLCCEYGKKAREWRRRFIGLLPEVYKRNLFRKKGFTSVHHFAAVIGGVSKEQVDLVLRLDKKFQPVPIFKNLLNTGEVSLHSLNRVASVVNKETEIFWVNQVKKLPQAALNTLVKDIQKKPRRQIQNTPGLDCHRMHFTHETEIRLQELESMGVEISQLINELLDKRAYEIQQKKDDLVKKYKDMQGTRYIPKEIRQVLQEEYGMKCAVPACHSPSAHNHHTLPFALGKNHNPLFIIPLCKNHHAIVHSIDKKASEMLMTMG